MTIYRISLIISTLFVLCLGLLGNDLRHTQAAAQYQADAQTGQQEEDALEAQLSTAIDAALSDFRREYLLKGREDIISLSLRTVVLDNNQLTIDDLVW